MNYVCMFIGLSKANYLFMNVLTCMPEEKGFLEWLGVG